VPAADSRFFDSPATGFEGNDSFDLPGEDYAVMSRAVPVEVSAASVAAYVGP
jgi:hypothetical protein